MQQALPELRVQLAHHLLAWSLLLQESALQERPARLFQRPGQQAPQPFRLLALQGRPSLLPSAWRSGTRHEVSLPPEGRLLMNHS